MLQSCSYEIFEWSGVRLMAQVGVRYWQGQIQGGSVGSDEPPWHLRPHIQCAYLA